MSEGTTVKKLDMSFVDSDSDDGLLVDIISDRPGLSFGLTISESDTDESSSANDEDTESSSDDDQLDTARMELLEHAEDDLPAIMVEIAEKKRQKKRDKHAAISAYNSHALESTADDYALPSVTPRTVVREQSNVFEDALLADFELPLDIPEPKTIPVPPLVNTYPNEPVKPGKQKERQEQMEQMEQKEQQQQKDTLQTASTEKREKTMKNQETDGQIEFNELEKLAEAAEETEELSELEAKEYEIATLPQNSISSHANDISNIPDPNSDLILVTKNTLERLETEIVQVKNQELINDKLKAKNAVESLASEVEKVEGINTRAEEAILSIKEQEHQMKEDLTHDRQVARERIQERIRRNKDNKQNVIHRKKQATTMKAASMIQKAYRQKKTYLARIDEQMKLEKQHEKEFKNKVEQAKKRNHDRLQARLARKKEATEHLHQSQTKELEQFQSKNKEELEQDLLSAGQVRRRLEKEISQIRQDFALKEQELLMLQQNYKTKEVELYEKENAMNKIVLEHKTRLGNAKDNDEQHQQKNATNELHTTKEQLEHALSENKMLQAQLEEQHGIEQKQNSQSKRTSHRGTDSQTKEHLEHALSENKRLQIKLEEQNGQMKKMEQLHTRNKNTWQIRLKVLQKNNIAEEQKRENDTRNADIATMEDTIHALREANHRLRTKHVEEKKLSRQMIRAKNLLKTERKKRSHQFVIVHVGDEKTNSNNNTETHLLNMSRLHDPTHVVRKNIIFEMAATTMLERTLDTDMGVENELPSEHGLCGALMAGQHIRLGKVYGGWACLDQPFQGSWINIAALGVNGLEAIGEKEGKEREKKSGRTMNAQERKAARDKAALIIYQVKALEKLADKGRRVLERLTTMVSNKRTSDSSKNNDKRTLQHLRNLFEQTSTDIISHRSPTATLNTTVKTRRKHSLASNSAPSLHDDTNNKTAPDGGVGLSMSVGFDQLRSTGKDSWLRQQEQHGMFAVPPLELAKRARARRAASKNLEQDIYSVDGPSEQLLHLFARLHTAATTKDAFNSNSENNALEWVNSKLPERVFHIVAKREPENTVDGHNMQMPAVSVSMGNHANYSKKRRPRPRHGISEATVTVYHFPLDGNPADLDAGTQIFHGQTSEDGKVTCRVSPGCYMIVVSLALKPGQRNRNRNRTSMENNNLNPEEDEGGLLLHVNKEARRLIVVDPARGHLDKKKVVVPIEV